MAITRDAEQDAHFDPSACVEVCRARYPNVRPAEIVAAVHGPRCGCHVGTLPETFSEVDSTYCTYQCKFYENPICGGPPSFWGVFVQYDFQAFSSHGAYDPWRKIWYTIAVVREATIIGAEAWNPDLQPGSPAMCIIRQCFSAAMTGIQCVVFDLDDTLWSTAATLEHAHEVMNNALQTELPEEPIESPEQFRDRMRAVQKDFPEREHDFGFCRREALMRMTGLGRAGAPKPDLRMFKLCEAKSGCLPNQLVMVGDNVGKDIRGAQAAGWRSIWVHPPKCEGCGPFEMAAPAAVGDTAADAEVDQVSKVEEVLLRWEQQGRL
eukprot:g30968.t1